MSAPRTHRWLAPVECTPPDAYGFVKLHQPAAFYGVPSERLELEGGTELSSGIQVCSYFERVLAKFLSTGRLNFFGSAEHHSDGEFTDSTGRLRTATIRRRLVDASYLTAEVPSLRPPKFRVEEGINLCPVNGLWERQSGLYTRFVVIGAGKTGIDAVLHLLDTGVEQSQISWICPNDSWLINRDVMAPGDVTYTLGLELLRAADGAKDLQDYFEKCVRSGVMFQLDSAVQPRSAKCESLYWYLRLVILFAATEIVTVNRMLRLSLSIEH